MFGFRIESGLMEQYKMGKEELVLSDLTEEDKQSLIKELLNSLLGKLKHIDPLSALEAFKEAKDIGLDDHTVISGHIYHNAGDTELKLSNMSDDIKEKSEHCEMALTWWKEALEQYPNNRKADRDKVQEKIDKNKSGEIV